MANIKYVSTNGIEFNLLDFDYAKLEKADFHKIKWGYESTSKQFGVIINKFKKDVQPFDCTFKFKGDPAQRKIQIDKFIFETEYDIATMHPGRIYWDEQYIEVYFISHDTYPVDSGMTWTELKGQFIAPYPFWIEEVTYHIDPSQGGVIPQRDDNKGYPTDRNMAYGYTYSYPYVGNSGTLFLDSPIGADFRTVAPGPISDFFSITAAGHLYRVNYPLRRGQTLVVDSRDTLPLDEKCYVINENGTTTNVFDYRDPSSLLFERLPGGNVPIYADKAYKFDITLFVERSAPR